MAALIACKHSAIEVYEDEDGRGFFGECLICETAGDLCETPGKARKAVKALKTKRRSKSGGAREGAGRPKILSEDTQAITANLLPRQVRKLEKWGRKQGIKGRSAALRAMIDAFKVT